MLYKNWDFFASMDIIEDTSSTDIMGELTTDIMGEGICKSYTVQNTWRTVINQKQKERPLNLKTGQWIKIEISLKKIQMANKPMKKCLAFYSLGKNKSKPYWGTTSLLPWWL